MIQEITYLPARSRIIFLTVFLLCMPARASNDNYPAGARSAAMGGVGVMHPGFWSIWHNQAGLGFHSHFSVGIHHENRYLVPEFGLSCIGITLPTSTGTFGLSWSHFGYPKYHENKIGLALGRAFHERFAVGLQIDYLNTFIDEELGSSGTVAIEAGILAEPVERLTVGFHVFNPTASSLPKLREEHIPVILRLGMVYRFGENLLLGVETEKDLDLAGACYRVGLEVTANEYIYVRTGISVQEYVQHAFGLGIHMRHFRADLAFSFQAIAGYTPYLSLRYVFR